MQDINDDQLEIFPHGSPLALDPESGLQRDLEFLDLAVCYPPAFLDHFEPVQVTDGLGGFSDRFLHALGETVPLVNTGAVEIMGVAPHPQTD